MSVDLERGDKMNQFHVAIAAEAYTAGILARLGYDVSVQYGANQPQYDLTVSKDKGDHLVRISVKGSQDGGWVLFAGYKEKGVDNHQAVERWAEKQMKGLIYCFVQFKGVDLDSSPRFYFATVHEIVEHMRTVRGGDGDTVLIENATYKKGAAKGVNDKIPEEWKFSSKRIEELFRRTMREHFSH